MPGLSPSDIRIIQRMISLVKSISGPGVRNDGNTITINPPPVRLPPPPSDLWEWVRLTGAATGAGIYTSRRQVPTPGNYEDPTIGFNAASYFQDASSSDDSYFRNLDESNAPTGVHLLKTDGTKYILARRSVFPSNDSPPKPIYELNAGGFPVAVTLSSPSGSYGSNGPTLAAAGLTYTVKTANGAVQIGTNVAVWPARQLGHVTAATKGYADVIGGTLYIVQHDEVIDTTSCG